MLKYLKEQPIKIKGEPLDGVSGSKFKANMVGNSILTQYTESSNTYNVSSMATRGDLSQGIILNGTTYETCKVSYLMVVIEART